MKKLVYTLTIFCLISSTIGVPVFNPAQAETKIPDHKTGEVLIKLKNNSQIYKFKFASENKMQELLNFYNADPDVEYAEPNYTYHISLEPTDIFFPNQTYLKEIKAPQAWNITTGSSSIKIAIIDTGVDINHPDLKNNIYTNPHEIAGNNIDDDENGYTDDVHGWDFVTNTNDPNPKLDEGYSTTGIKHGTVVAGVAAAQNGDYQGVVGVSWRTKIIPLRVLNGDGQGDTQTVAQAIDYAVAQGANIINLSFVGEGRSYTLENSIQKAYQAGVLVVAAAGNEVAEGINLDDKPAYPVSHDGPNGENWVMGVASIDKNDRLASFSNYGSKNVDISAPGVGITSTVFHIDNNSEFGNLYETGWTGTSVSAPQVSGAAALIMSARPDLSLAQIKNLLIDNADKIDDKNSVDYQGLLGSGRLNVYASLSHSLYQTASEAKVSHIITTPATNGAPYVDIFKKTNVENQFLGFEESFKNGLSLAAGDIDNDGTSEVVVGLGPGTFPWVKIFNPDSSLENKIVVYDEKFKGGVEVALGDIDGDGILDIITGAGPGGGPHVRIFSADGNPKGQFFAFDKSDRSGIELTSADINGDNQAEIIVAKKSGPPEVRIFKSDGTLIKSFLAYDKNFKGGVHLATADLNNDGQAEIITGPGSGNKPQIKIFNGRNSELINEFSAYNQNFFGGVFATAADVDGDGDIEIVTGAGPGGGPHVRVFNSLGQPEFNFFAYDERFRGGVKVGAEK